MLQWISMFRWFIYEPDKRKTKNAFHFECQTQTQSTKNKNKKHAASCIFFDLEFMIGHFAYRYKETRLILTIIIYRTISNIFFWSDRFTELCRCRRFSSTLFFLSIFIFKLEFENKIKWFASKSYFNINGKKIKSDVCL